jgi:hypothetical protein
MDKEWRKTPRQRSEDKDEVSQTKKIGATKAELTKSE